MTVTVEFAKAVPLIVGVALLSVDPLVGALMAGAARTHALPAHEAPLGQLLSERQRTHDAVPTMQKGVAPLQSELARQPAMTTKVFVALAALVTASAPAPNKAFADTVWLPSVSAMVTVHCHFPSAAAVVVPKTAPSIVTATVVLATAVPDTEGEVLVCEPFEGNNTVGAASTHAFEVHEDPVGQSLAVVQRTHVPAVALHAGVPPAHAAQLEPHAVATEHDVQPVLPQTMGSLATSLNTNPDPLTPAGSASIRRALFDVPHAMRSTVPAAIAGAPLAPGGLRITASGIYQSRK